MPKPLPSRSITPSLSDRTVCMRSLFLAPLVAALTALPAQAHAEDHPLAQPPVLLSPDLQEPWLLSYRAVKKRPAPNAAVPRHAPPQALLIAAPLTKPPARPAAQSAGQRPNRAVDPAFLPTLVAYAGPEQPGTIVIDTKARYLYLVEAGGRARRYGVGVGKPGFEWAGEHRITRKAEWPDWTPPIDMIERRPDLPRHMAGGPGNPLGARAMYLGSTLYRIHGTTEPWSIGKAVSSGCIRMRNEDVIDLYGRVVVGTRVIVM